MDTINTRHRLAKDVALQKIRQHIQYETTDEEDAGVPSVKTIEENDVIVIIDSDDEDQMDFDETTCAVCMCSSKNMVSCVDGHTACPECFVMYIREPQFGERRSILCPSGCRAAMKDSTTELCKWMRRSRSRFVFNGNPVDLDSLVHELYQQMYSSTSANTNDNSNDFSAFEVFMAMVKYAGVDRTPCCNEPFAGVENGYCMKVYCNNTPLCQMYAFCYWCMELFPREETDHNGESIGHYHVRTCPLNPQQGTVFAPEDPEQVTLVVKDRIRSNILKLCDDCNPYILRKAASFLLKEYDIDVKFFI